MNTRPGMTCTDCHLTDVAMHDASSNDDASDPFSAADLMGMVAWAIYCETWQPLRWVPARRAGARRSA